MIARLCRSIALRTKKEADFLTSDLPTWYVRLRFSLAVAPLNGLFEHLHYYFSYVALDIAHAIFNNGLGSMRCSLFDVGRRE